MIRAIVGANWGDEGKGKITDHFAQDADIVVRYQGGSNAGHTIVNSYGRFALHQLPSGVFSAKATNVIANGVALDIPKLFDEIKSITDGGGPKPNLMVSERAHALLPYHVLLDQYEEERLGGRGFGSTKSGIAPFYSDKYQKIGVQICELFDEQVLSERIEKCVELKNVVLKHLYKKPELDKEQLLATLAKYRDMIAPYVGDTTTFLLDAAKQDKKILLEGQLGALKDPDFGIYPFVTSSSTLAGYAPVGCGVHARDITNVTTVVKAYSSAVGAGAFVSEIFGDEAHELRERGGDAGEYGATTGRPRRMGWFDAVATKYGCTMQGATEVALTVLDALGYLDEIPVCVAYEIDGVKTTKFPTTPKLNKAKPILERLPGWRSDIRGVRDYNLLPENARKYVEFIQKHIEVPISMVSTGPGREELIIR